MFYLLTDSYTVRPEMIAQTGSVIRSSIIKYNSEAEVQGAKWESEESSEKRERVNWRKQLRRWSWITDKTTVIICLRE